MNFAFKRLFTLRNQFLLSASFTQISSNISSTNCQATQPSSTNFFKFANHMIPHPTKVKKGGEDAQFSTEKILVVADGVGGWADYGIDPGLYSKELCLHIGNLFTKDPKHYIFNPKELIEKSHQLTKAVGSTTVCLITLEDEKLLLRTAFVGDSGYAIYRMQDQKYSLVFKSQEQQKGFNFPYQIGSEGDHPSCAIADEHQVKPLDVIVVGTDGLFDNINAEQIKSILDDDYKSKQNVDVTRIAKLIAGYAYRLSLDQGYASPFARSAKAHGLNFQGGKSDDITVIVAEINQGTK